MSQRLTALIPAHNEEYLLDLCLRSLVDHFDEIVVLDDCSTDRTWDVAGDALRGHPRFMMLRGATPGAGWIEARNRLLAATDSDWLFFLDADDVLCEYNARLLRQIAEGRQPVVRLQLAELWGDFHHTTGRYRHYDRCHTFVNRRIVGDLAWGGGTTARPQGNGRGGWRAKGGPGPLLIHCKGVKPDRRLVERQRVRGWMGAGRPGRLEEWADLDELSAEQIHRRALHMLLESRQDRIRRVDDRMPRLPRVIREAPDRFEIVYDGDRPVDRLDHGTSPPGGPSDAA